MGEKVAVQARAAEGESERRIAAVVLPELLCELVSLARRGSKQPPLGVVLAEGSEFGPDAKLEGVNAAAQRFGVCPGQSIAEARALLASLEVRPLSREKLQAALGRVAEAALAFGPTVGIQLPSPSGAGVSAGDTVWVDITGSAHLFGGEAKLLFDLGNLVRGMGHVTRMASARGPRLAQALARYSPLARALRKPRIFDTAEEIAALPIMALPLEAQQAAWLARLGILTVGDLGRLPRASAAARLGEGSREVLDFCEGRDPTPLVAYQPARVLAEEVSFDAPVDGSQPLLFALRGLLFRLSVRLAGRGEAAHVVRLQLLHDRSIAQLRRVSEATELQFELPSPLWREEELWRVIVARLERTELTAPTVSLRLEVPEITRAVTHQLELGQVASGATALQSESLPALLAELTADLGPEQVGVLEYIDSHRPEAKSRLVPLQRRQAKRRKKQEPQPACPPFAHEPTRLFSPPVPIHTELRVGATFAIHHRLYTIEEISFEQRLDVTEWWSPDSVSRDYLRLRLAGVEGMIEALVFVDRKSGARFLQAILD